MGTNSYALRQDTKNYRKEDDYPIIEFKIVYATEMKNFEIWKTFDMADMKKKFLLRKLNKKLRGDVG